MTASTLASQFSLSSSTSVAFPSATLSNTQAQSLITSSWSLSNGRIQDGSSNIAFVADPFPNSNPGGTSTNTSAPVLQVTYPQGGFGSVASGTQFYSLWNSSSGFQSMLLSYEVAFDSNFNWVLGGKLPGLRGGPDPNTCSGGSLSNGNCFSTRMMWRSQGAGEAYAYMLPPPNGCPKSFICNAEFGTSIDRGSFTFQSGQWNRISLFVQLNSPPNTANGQIQVYMNDVKAFSAPNLLFSNASGLTIGGLYFSTFYGGNTAAWAPTSDTHTYFRNIELWGGSSPSNLTVTSSATTAMSVSWLAGVVLLVIHLGRMIRFI